MLIIYLSIVYLDKIYRIFRIFLPFPRSAGQAAERKGKVRIISARPMTKQERKIYEEG